MSPLIWLVLLKLIDISWWASQRKGHRDKEFYGNILWWMTLIHSDVHHVKHQISQRYYRNWELGGKIFCTKDSDDCYMIDAPKTFSAAYQTTRRLVGFRLKVSQLSLHISNTFSTKANVSNGTKEGGIRGCLLSFSRKLHEIKPKHSTAAWSLLTQSLSKLCHSLTQICGRCPFIDLFNRKLQQSRVEESLSLSPPLSTADPLLSILSWFEIFWTDLDSIKASEMPVAPRISEYPFHQYCDCSNYGLRCSVWRRN